MAATPTPLVVGHRGAMVSAPENTMAAFRLAQSAGADVLELDVRWTKDRGMVVLHDETLDRTTNCYGKIQHRLFVQIRQCDAGSDQGLRWAREKIPTLAATLAFARDAGLQVNVAALCPHLELVRRPVRRGRTVRRDGLPPELSPRECRTGDPVSSGGIAVWVWDVTSSADLTKASKLGADALIVDDPRTAVAALRR